MNAHRLTQLLSQIARGVDRIESAIDQIERSRLPYAKALAEDLREQCFACPADPHTIAEDYIDGTFAAVPSEAPTP